MKWPSKFCRKLSSKTRSAWLASSGKPRSWLYHPNIAGIHGLEQEGTTHAIAMELVEGETLAARISKGAIPLEEALPIALQITEALEVAHEKGIIHRDLKPANVIVTPEGTAKVLDFGLAKAMEPAASPDAELNESPTLTMQATQAGMILGTAAYMSPEQARGKPVDRRADIWAFGALLFEMLTGRKSFQGEDISMTLAQVLSQEPQWETLPELPGRVEDLLRRCLRKETLQRVQAIGDVRIALQETLADPSADTEVAAPTAPTPPAWQRWLPWAGMALFAAVALLAVAWPDPPLQELPMHKFHLDEEGALQPRVSPDGASIAFRREGSIWIRRLDQLEARQVEGTEGGSNHFWSADSASLAFVRRRQLWKVSATDGGPQIICDLLSGPLLGGSWGTDGSIVFSQGGGEEGGGFHRVSANGGDPETILPYEPGASRFIHPHILPDGKGIVFAQQGQSKIELFDGQSRRLLLEREGAVLSDPVYSEPGHLIFSRTGSNEGIWAISLSLDRLEVAGQDLRLSSEVGIPSVSQDGTLVYGPGSALSTLRQLVWVSRSGEVLQTIGQPQNGMIRPALSPDEKRVAVAAAEPSLQTQIWIHDIERSNKRVITFGDAIHDDPFWLPEGDQVGYNSGTSIQIRRTDGSGQEEFLADGSSASLSSDGKYLVYVQRSESTGNDIWYLEIEGDRTPRVFLNTPHSEDSSALSPDGNYLAYESNESGRQEIHLKRFPTAEGSWMLSVGGGGASPHSPFWSKDGKELYFWQGELMVVEVDTGSSDPQRGDPQRLFSGIGFVTGGGSIDISRDGRFLMIQTIRSQQDEDKGQLPIVVIENWFAEFKNHP